MNKYLRYLLLIGIIAVSMAPAYVFSLDNLSSSLQPTGFRGVNWGASKLDHPYLFTVYDSIDGVDTMHRELENLTFGSVKLAGIIYHFYNDQFYQVSMTIRSDNDHKLLLGVLVEAYGTPGKESGIFKWKNDTVSISLFPEGASITYLPILNKIDQKQNNG